MFQVASQQNWPYVMWDAMRATGKVRGIGMAPDPMLFDPCAFCRKTRAYESILHARSRPHYVCNLLPAVLVCCHMATCSWYWTMLMAARTPHVPVYASGPRESLNRSFPAVQPATAVAAVFCFFYLTTNYVLGSLLLAGILEQFNLRDTEARRLQRRAIVRKLQHAEVPSAAECCLPL